MRNDVSTNRFLWVGSEHGGSIDLCNDLICYHDSHAKLHITTRQISTSSGWHSIEFKLSNAYI